MTKVKIGLISLGCAKNQVDLEKLAGRLRAGYDLTVDTSHADILIRNTCVVIRSGAEQAM